MKMALLIAINFVLFAQVSFATTNILFLGDSLSEGQGLEEQYAFPRVVEKNLIAKKHDVKVINGGVSGSTSANGLSRLNWHMKKKIDILVLELGANDGLRGLKLTETEKNLRGIIEKAREKNAKVLLLGVLMPPNYGKKYTQEFQDMYARLSSSLKVPQLPFLLKDVGGKPEFNLADGIHPNAKGHEMVAKLVTDFVEKHL